MAETIITLTEAVELREKIQNQLVRNQRILRNENTVPKSQKRNYDLKEIVLESASLREKMVQLKLIIQRANLIVPEGETEPISFYVYLLSELKRHKENLMVIPCLSGKVPMSTIESDVSMSKDSLVDCHCFITEEQKEKELAKITKEYYSILSKLPKLNSSIKVKIPFETKI